MIDNESGAELVEVYFSTDRLQSGRRMLERRVIAAALLPFVLLGLAMTGVLVSRRAGARATPAFFAWTAAVGAAVLAAAFALVGLVRLAAIPDLWSQLALSFAWLALATLFPGAWWWRRGRRRSVVREPLRFAIEQLAAGVVAGALVVAAARVLDARITAASFDKWQLPLFPLDLSALLYLASLLITQIALAWTIGPALAAMAARWDLSWRSPARALLGVVLWLAPLGALLAARQWMAPPVMPALVAAGTAALFALAGLELRHLYRHTTQALRLVLVFAALFLPILALYPMAAFYATTAAQRLVETQYSPATSHHRDNLKVTLLGAESEIDRVAELPALVATPAQFGVISTQAAFQVWSQTSLSTNRVTSDLELYGPSRNLVSRFALNVPDFVYSTSAQVYQGSSCSWDLYAEVKRFLAEDRLMLHAERGLCDGMGRLAGAIVVHVVLDYESLPFVASADPYADVIGPRETNTAESRIADLQVAIYGWSLHPMFASGSLTWPIDGDLAARLTAAREPFWRSVAAGDRTYRVYFSSDRSQIYAIGYPDSTLFEHAARLAEAASLTAAMFLVLLLGATVYAPFARRTDVPLRRLFHEIRTSFYRKLFLFFVLAAIGPVLLLALLFGAYMTSKFRADVRSEAVSVVTVAQRVFQGLAAVQDHPDQPSPPPNDDVMVWIGQVIHQDVNLFNGARLVATSQRDLFDSGLLPSRTPAGAYRAIALDRLPATVAEDRLGGFQYLVAAAPVPGQGPDAVLSVPLALRQREIEREIDELNRGMLIAGVLVVLFGAGLGASVAGRISDPVSRLTRATRQIAAGRLDVRIVADTADELRRLVDDFNSMAATLGAQRAELGRTHQLKAWAEMARQVAHEIKNPLTPIQLAAEHLQRVHADAHRPLGAVFDRCVTTILGQVKLLRQIAGEFSTYAVEPTVRAEFVPVPLLIEDVIGPYRAGLAANQRVTIDVAPGVPAAWIDRTLVARALTNLVENALQAMPEGGTLHLAARAAAGAIELTVSDTGVGMDAEQVRRAFEPYFSTKTGGSGLGVPNAKRNIERCGGTLTIASAPGRGTTMTVTLPAAPPNPVEGASA